MDKTFTLDELAALVNLSKRTIRYYMQIGLIPRPIGETRAAYYTREHLDRLLQLQKWIDAGISLERIRDLFAGETAPAPPRPRRAGSVEVRSHIFVAPGIEIQISPEESGAAPEQVRELTRRILAAAETVLAPEESF